MIAEGVWSKIQHPFHDRRSMRYMNRILYTLDRQRRLFALSGPSLELPAEEQRELRMVIADLLLNAATGKGRDLDPVHGEETTRDEHEADR